MTVDDDWYDDDDDGNYEAYNVATPHVYLHHKKGFFFFRKKSLISVPVHHPSTSRTQKVNICLKKGRLFKAKNRFFKTNLGFFYFDPQPIDVFCFFLKKRFFGTFPNLNGDDGDNEGNDISLLQ